MKRKCIVGVFVLAVLGFSLAWGAVAALGAASQVTLAITLSGDAHPIQVPVAGGEGGFKGTLTVTDLDIVNGVLSVLAQMEGVVADAEGNLLPVMQSILIPVSNIKALPDLGTDNCIALALQGNETLLQLQVLGLNIVLRTPQIDLTAIIPFGTPICNLLHGKANVVDFLFTHPDVLIELLR